jgi:uncharacterized protein
VQNSQVIGNDDKAYRILCIDGGGIAGTFPASFLASMEDNLDRPIGEYFDLIAGTSTGGIIALGLALGLSAVEITEFYEKKGPAIFGQDRGPILNRISSMIGSVRQIFTTKHSPTNL